MCSSLRTLVPRPAFFVVRLLLLLPVARAAAAPDEVGRPVLRHYAPGEHLRYMSNPIVTQDAAGVMYFGCGGNLLTYDGARWGDLVLPTESAGVREFAVTRDGTIYLGGAGVLGVIRGAGSNAAYVSLVDQLPPAERNVDEIQHAAAIGETVFFSDERRILRYRGGRFTVIPFSTPPSSRGARLHAVGDALYVTALAHGLGRLVNDTIEPVADDRVLREDQIVLLEQEKDGSLVLLTARRGFFRLSDVKIAPLATEANRWLANEHVYRALRLTDGSLVVGFSATSGDGGMRFAADGRFLSPIDNSIGLLAKTLRGFFRDREGGLWIGMETGTARLEWPSTVSLFDSANGLGQGAVAAVTRHDSVIYAATGEGLFRLVPADEAGRSAHFERIFNRPVSALVSHPAGLLALGFGGVLSQTRDGFSPVARFPSQGGVMLRSKRDPDRIWVGTARELHSLHHGPDGWNDEGPIPGFTENCRALREASDGALWITTADHGDFRVDVAGEKRNVPQAVGRTDGRELAKRFGPGATSNPAGDSIVAANDEAKGLPHFLLATLGTVQQVHKEAGPDGAVLWVAGANGLARVETTPAIPASVPFTTQLHARTLHDGDRLPPEHGPITFEFLAPRQRPTSAVSYQTRLVGLEREWSKWSIKRTRDFSLLPPGRYRFSVRARDAEGIVTPPAEIGFTVLPPWWATAWAIAGYAAVGLGVIAGVVQTRTLALRRRAEHLEGVVTQRTAELAQRNLELIRLHQLELDEKISARLAEEKARLEVLRYQLNPHFLFNTLASISASLPEGRSTARTMVERLADFCRLTLHRSDDRDWTTLGEELELLRAYLEIEQSRWSDLLSITLASDPALDAERIPHFLLLPLVENALKYGRATSQERVGFRLTTRREPDGAMVFEVSNTGEWIEPTGKRSTSSLGIGLENLRERLLRYFPRQHQLTFSHANGWVTVTLRLAVRHTRSMEPIPTDRSAPPPAGSP